MHALFTYGTLSLKEIAKFFIGNKEGIVASLPGFRAAKIIISSETLVYPALVPTKNEICRGILYRDLSDEELRQIDLYEGNQYTRMKVQVEVNNQLVTAWTYLWNEPESIEISKENWSVDQISKEEIEAFIQSELE